MLAAMSSSSSNYYSPQQQHPHYTHWQQQQQQQRQSQHQQSQHQPHPHHHRDSSPSSASSPSRLAPPTHSFIGDANAGEGGSSSSSNSSSGGGGKGGEMKSMGVLTATGRKRKRLQRACVACHKAKRRCDGGLPCSNCDFSGRQCTYSDAQGKTVPPTQRTPSTSNQTFSLTQNPQLWQQQQQQQQQGMKKGPASLPTTSPLHGGQHQLPIASASPEEARSPCFGRATSPSSIALEPSAEVRRSLLSTFFSQLSSFSTVFDEVVFLRDLSTSEVPQVLLYAIYAVSAHYQERTASRASGSDRVCAESYAKVARRMLYEEDPETGLTMLDDAQIETSQALCMLAAYELGVGRMRRASIMMSLCHRILVDIRLHEGIVPLPKRATSYSETSTGANLARRAHCQRFLAMAWMLDIAIAALAGTSPSFRPAEIDMARNVFASTTSHASLDDVTMSYIHTLGAVDIFSQALEYVSRKTDGAGCEAALHRWAESLPPKLVFDLENLGSAATVLQGSSAASTSSSSSSSPPLHQHRAAHGPNDASRHPPMSMGAAQNWSVMHSLAESAMFLVSSMSAAPDATSRRDAALENLVMILETMGSQVRQSPFALVPILICSRAMGGVNGSGQARMWLDEARALWALGNEQLIYEKLVGSVRSFAAPSWSLSTYGSNNGNTSSTSASSRYPPQPPRSDPSTSPPRRLSPPLIRHHNSGSGYHLPPLMSSSASSSTLPSLRFSPPSAGTTPSSVSDRRLSPPDHPAANLSLSLPALPSPSKLYHQSSKSSAMASTSPTGAKSVDPFRLEGGGRSMGLLASVHR